MNTSIPILLAFLASGLLFEMGQAAPQILGIVGTTTGTAATTSLALTPLGALAGLGLLGGGLALGAAALAASQRGGRRRGGRRRSFGRRSYRRGGYYRRRRRGRRDVATAYVEVTVAQQIEDLFYRASQTDDDQCVRRLICELNAAPDEEFDAQAKWVKENLLLTIFGSTDDLSASPFPELDLAAQVGERGGSEKCAGVYSKCKKSADDLKKKVLDFKLPAGKAKGKPQQQLAKH